MMVSMKLWQKRVTVVCEIRSNHSQMYRLFVEDPHQKMMASVHFESFRELKANVSNIAINFAQVLKKIN